MVLSDEKKRQYIRRLQLSRMRLLCNNGFYGLLLMNMQFSLDETCETAATDGRRIYFGPRFLEDLSDRELDFILMHEVLHVVLQHCLRTGDRDRELFNIACDIVVNSNILLSNHMDKKSITLQKYGESMHLAPDGKEGHEYTAEQVYAMLSSGQGKGKSSGNGKKDGKGISGKGESSEKGGKNPIGGISDNVGSFADDHTRWGTVSDEMLRDLWVKRFEDACEAISIRDPSNQRGLLPRFAQRMLQELKKPQTDWRTVLNEFVQEDITDYSFTPPDRRFEGSPFFLPDFNEKEDRVENILFMIDTSGSMSDEMITAAYSEIKGAIDQFHGKLQGWLGFFDAGIVEPKPFSDEDGLRVIRPAGGGGTDFSIIFEYVQRFMQDKAVASIVILTDGYAPFPEESCAGGIPVLWLLNNEKVEPPWGKIARIVL